MRKIREVLRLKFEAQLTDREIARAVPTSRGTVQNYLERAQAAGVSWPLPEGMDEEKLEALLFPQGEARPGQPQPDFDAIRDELSRHKGMTRMLCVFRRCQPPIPVETSHRFRLIPATHSG